jgi:hypothetical protein
MLAISHDGGGFGSNLSKVLAYLTYYPNLPYIKWAMKSHPVAPWPGGTFAYDVPEVFSCVYQQYGEVGNEAPISITSDPLQPAQFRDGSQQLITSHSQHALYLKPGTWRDELNATYRKFCSYRPVVSDRLAAYDSRLQRYPHRVALLSRGHVLAGEQPGKCMPPRCRYERLIAEYKRKYSPEELVFFLCVDNQADLAHYSDYCHPYPVVVTDIHRAETQTREPHVGQVNSVAQAIASIVEMELCARCEALIHPVSNMATLALVMNPTMVSHYLYLEDNAIICWYPDGLSNRLQTIVNGVFLRQTQRPVYNYWEQNACFPGVASSDIFTNPLDELAQLPVDCVPYPEYPMVKAPGVLSWLQQHPGRVVLRCALVEGDVPTSFIRQTLRSLKWHPDIADKYERERSQHRIDRSVIGIHARGTDYCYGGETRQAYVLDVLRRASSEQRFYLSTDDEKLKQEVRDRFPNVVTVDRLPRYAPGSNTDAVVDLLLLAATNFQHYSVVSTFSWVALALSDAPLASIPRRNHFGTAMTCVE